MEQSTWTGVRTIVLAVTILLILPLQAQAERNWEFSAGAFGGEAFHSNEDMKINFGEGGGFTTGTAHGLNLNDSPTFGAKVTAWHLPRQYKWQPQIGLELDYTKFTADLHPQIAGASGTSLTPGSELGSWIITAPQDFSVNILAANLLFRYPIWATPEMPQGRFYPYIGAGVGVEKVRSSDFPPGHQANNYAPAVQGLVGIKFFLIKNFGIFAEWKRTTGWHTFDYNGSSVPTGYSERWTFGSNLVVGGIALHF